MILTDYFEYSFKFYYQFCLKAIFDIFWGPLLEFFLAIRKIRTKSIFHLCYIILILIIQLKYDICMFNF